MWIKNTSGKEDAMLTFAVIAFVVVIFRIVFEGLHVSIGTYINFVLQKIDDSTILSILGPTLLAYFGRRGQSLKFSNESKKNE